MSLNFQEWHQWLVDLARTILTIAVAYFVGVFINRIVITRLVGLARRTPGNWDDIVSAEIRRRVSSWAILAGAWLSLAYWPIPAFWRTFAADVIIAIGGLSITLAVSAIATGLVAHYAPKAVWRSRWRFKNRCPTCSRASFCRSPARCGWATT